MRYWDDNIKMYLTETVGGKGTIDLNHAAQEWCQWPARVITVMNFRIPLNAEGFTDS
jgi:hypothetical protein